MKPVTDLVVDMLASYRITRLVTTDTITAPLRARIPAESLPGELVRCGWCMSAYAALAVMVLPRWLRRVLACSAVAGILSEHYSD